jgi:hypothetical protein
MAAAQDKFFGTDLDSMLKAKGISTVIITGWRVNGAVVYTSVGATLRGYTVVVPEDTSLAATEYDVAIGRYQILTQLSSVEAPWIPALRKSSGRESGEVHAPTSPPLPRPRRSGEPGSSETPAGRGSLDPDSPLGGGCPGRPDADPGAGSGEVRTPRTSH